MIEIREKEVLKKYEFDILKEVHLFCIANDIKYFLWGGTLLGAIRHNGFIPWDDDIDIAMFRDDYNRFMKEFKSDRYIAYSCENCDKYPFAYGKVIDNQTLKVEPIKSSIEMGIDIDIFPIDDFRECAISLSNNKRRMRLITQRNCLLFKFNHKKFIKSMLINTYSLILGMLGHNPNKISRKINENGQIGLKSNDDYMLYADTNIKKPLIIKKDWVEKLILHKFEDEVFFIPSGYDDLLKACYGDYMVLPPIEKRISHHSNKNYIK